MSDPSIISLVTPSDTIVYNCDAEQTMTAGGSNPDSLLTGAKAFLQKLYDHIENL